MPPEQLGEERLEEDEVDDEDLATGDGPGLRERRKRTTLWLTRHGRQHAKAALQDRSSCNPPKPKKQTPHPKTCLSIWKMSKTKLAMSTWPQEGPGIPGKIKPTCNFLKHAQA